MIILALRFIAEQPTIQELFENGKYPFFISFETLQNSIKDSTDIVELRAETGSRNFLCFPNDGIEDNNLSPEIKDCVPSKAQLCSFELCSFELCSFEKIDYLCG